MAVHVVQRFQQARRDPSLVVIEGFHALKHAARFGAQLEAVVTSDPTGLAVLAGSLAPDVARVVAEAQVVDADTLARLAPRAPRTGVLAIARRPVHLVETVVASERLAPIVLLEDPRTMGNVGACVRVAAGAGAAGVITTGPADPWHPDAVRGGAGLQFALPVLSVAPEAIPVGRPLLAIDPEGDDLDGSRLPPRAILAFGTERDGLSGDLLSRADARIRIPMEPGVSSLNLATSVSAVLYAWRLMPR